MPPFSRPATTHSVNANVSLAIEANGSDIAWSARVVADMCKAERQNTHVYKNPNRSGNHGIRCPESPECDIFMSQCLTLVHDAQLWWQDQQKINNSCTVICFIWFIFTGAHALHLTGSDFVFKNKLNIIGIQIHLDTSDRPSPGKYSIYRDSEMYSMKKHTCTKTCPN